jgi:hypothetical protein
VEKFFDCDLGFRCEISQQNNWGYSQPVITSIDPHSPATDAGLKVNDIIEKINGAPTKGLSQYVVSSWLKTIDYDYVILSISNFEETEKEVSVKKKCNYTNSLSEKDLAVTYSFYSLEDVQKRSFSCPFKTKINQYVDYRSYKTFGFYPPDPANQELETILHKAIRASLEGKGLVYTEKNPDMIVNTYYSYNPNQAYNPLKMNDAPTVSRYNVYTNKIQRLPIYEHSSNYLMAKIFLTMGVQLIDRARSLGDRPYIIWECVANELLKSSYSLNEYSAFHIPLMFMQYPYLKSPNEAYFFYNDYRFNYTGIYYNQKNLKQIMYIDTNSPADRAGFREDDIVEKINKIQFPKNQKDADFYYKQFVFDTMTLRDPKTQYVNAYGFNECMFWDKLQLPKIAEKFADSENFQAAFSYLFCFEPYIHLSNSNVLVFDIKRDKQKIQLKVIPNLISESTIETMSSLFMK